MSRGIAAGATTPIEAKRSSIPLIGVTAFGIDPPHPKQARFIATSVENVGFFGGQGSGKSTALCLKTILMALDPRNAKKTVALCVPTYVLANRVHRPMLEDMFEAWSRNVGYSLLARYRRSQMIFELINGAQIWLQSYERVDRLRSMNLAAAGIDEIEQDRHPLETYRVISGRVRGKGTNQIAVTTTPKGYREVVKLFIDRVAEKDQRYQFITCRSDENPAITQEKIELWRSMYSKAWFAQEVEAKILRPSSVIFPEFSRMRHTIPFEMARGIPWSIGCDWGYSSPHFLAMAHVLVDGLERDVVFWEYCDDDPAAYVQRKALTDIIQRWGNPVDLTGDRAVKEWNAWARTALGCATHTMETKEEQKVWRGVQVVRQRLDPADGIPRLLFAKSLLKTQSERGIIACVEQYERERNPEGELMDKAKKDNRWDNGVDALRYAIVTRHGHLMQEI